MEIKLTQFSHGAGCGCKIAPAVLDSILKASPASAYDPKLLVGHDKKDDAAVYDLGNGKAIISTTDFFMPIVDDAFDFGRIASVNALSDVYAMGGKPLLAIAILGWPVNKIPTELAGKVLEGARKVCADAGIPLAGGHSVDSEEPFFGLAVTGEVEIKNLKKNSSATEGCSLFLTKPLGTGIITTAQKTGVVKEEDLKNALDTMLQLNKAGEQFGKLPYVKAMTDITGFGLLGHLGEMIDGSDLSAEIESSKIPVLPNIDQYLKLGCMPNATTSNWSGYYQGIEGVTDNFAILCDPQTSGGLLVAVESGKENDFIAEAKKCGLDLSPFGKLVKRNSIRILVR
ncbi:MAG TPA: selenide, water dikinase SelD [Bacteroidia bacterium]|jgi:selenide,water dikinase|nr:selenide, water dikinase SelD [Bacteroidia bacterium]